MYNVGNMVGRMLTIRFTGTVTLEEADAAIAGIRKQVGACKDRVVLCGDLRGMRVLAPAVSERFVALFRNDNPRVERSAMLLDDENAGGGATVSLQLERMVREGGSPGRRTFRNEPQMRVWLKEVLTPAESAVAEAFLKER